MKNLINICELDYTLDEYYMAKNLSMEARNKINTVDILAMPEKYEDNRFYFAQETINFLKYCKMNEKGYRCDYLADGENIEFLDLHSFDIWMPIIKISSIVLLPIVVNLVSCYVYDKLKGRENEASNVHVSFSVKKDNEEKLIKFDGDVKAFKESFEKIDINKL